MDTTPKVLASNFAPGIGGAMACSSSQLVFADGPLQTLYGTDLTTFHPRRLLTAPGKIGPISSGSGPWIAFTVYTQSGEQLSPLGAWAVYAVQVASGVVIKLASGANATELSEMPVPAVGEGFIVWDELMPGAGKVLWLYDLNTGLRKQLVLPQGMYPVTPAAMNRDVLFLDNSRDPRHASEVWYARGGEPILLDIDSGTITHPATQATVFRNVLASSRAVWVAPSADGSTYEIQEFGLQTGKTATLNQTSAVTPVWANDEITVWENGSGAVMADANGRKAIVSPDLTGSPGGIALCGNDLYYAGPFLSLRVAHIV